jgi:hypothetical protein
VASNSSSTSGKGAAVKPIVWMNFIRRLAGWSTGEKCLLYTVGLHADKDTGEAYPSIKTLMDEAALGKTFTIQTLKKAINRRLLRERRKGYGDQRYWQRTYTLTIPVEDEILGSLTEPTIGELGSLTEQLGSLSESAKISQTQTQSGLEADFSGAIRSLSEYISTSSSPPSNSLSEANENHQSQTQNSGRTPPKRVNEHSVGFERFYAAYPRKVAKREAIKAWDKLAPDDELIERILDSLERQKASWAAEKQERKFIPYPASWLNGQRWEDEVENKPIESKPLPTGRKRGVL